MRQPDGTVTTTVRRVLLTLSVSRRAPAWRRTSTGTPIPWTWSAAVFALLRLPDGTMLSLSYKKLPVRCEIESLANRTGAPSVA